MIRKLQAKNFMSLKETSLELSPVNLLVGPNMAGKSNLLKVFRFLASILLPRASTYGLPNALASLGGFQEVLWKGSTDNFLSIALEGEVMGAKPVEGSWRFNLALAGDQWGNARVQEESLVLRAPNNSYELIAMTQGRRQLRNVDGKEISTIDDSTRSALEFEIPGWDGSFFRQLISGTRFYSLVPHAMRGANPTASSYFLNEYGDNLSSWLLTLQTLHKQSFARIESLMKDTLPGLESIFTVPTQQTTVTLASMEKYLNRPTTLAQMSDGELAFAALLSLILSPTDFGAPIYCIEEPENYLHPRLIEVLVEIWRQVRDELGPDKCSQVFLTTHSPYLIDKFRLEELIVAEKNNGATSFTRPSTDKELRDLVTRKEIGLGDLYFSGALRGSR